MRADPWNRPSEYAEEKWWWIFKNPVGFVILATVIIVFIIISWHLFKTHPKNSDGIPVISAPKSPIKIKPEDPGGDIIPDQDKSVYQNLVKKNDKKVPKDVQVERILLPPSVDTILDPPETQKAEVKTEVKPEIKAEPANITQAIDKAIETIPKKPAPKKIKGKGFKIQIASLRSPEKAKAEWERVKTLSPDLLSDLPVSYLKVDMGEKGIYTSVRAGLFQTKNEAVEVCKRLKQRRINCMVK
jgi:hypothetical protein